MAASPRTIAAVDAMLASRQVAAATVTVRKGPVAGRLVRGSMMWWSTAVPRVQRRTVVLEVATPPAGTQITSPSASGLTRLSSSMWIRQPPEGGVPAIAMSPPRLTSTPPVPAAARAALAARSTASAFAAEPAVGRVDVLENLPHRGGRAGERTGIGGEDVHRGAQRRPALDREGHHEPPLVTVPLPLLPVVGACVEGCRLLLLLVELELELELESVVVVVDVVVSAAVADAFADDLPAYEAAAT